jgi:hypothetical protein
MCRGWWRPATVSGSPSQKRVVCGGRGRPRGFGLVNGHGNAVTLRAHSSQPGRRATPSDRESTNTSGPREESSPPRWGHLVGARTVKQGSRRTRPAAHLSSRRPARERRAVLRPALKIPCTRANHLAALVRHSWLGPDIRGSRCSALTAPTRSSTSRSRPATLALLQRLHQPRVQPEDGVHRRRGDVLRLHVRLLANTSRHQYRLESGARQCVWAPFVVATRDDGAVDFGLAGTEDW